MPLEHGSSREVISRNIKKEVAAGHPARQAVAIAIHTARVPRKNAAADSGTCHAALCGAVRQLKKFARG
jgi:hypothetical protein